jgi:hypothetical protein
MYTRTEIPRLGIELDVLSGGRTARHVPSV